jgi:HAE1 family hydrophobic/amphiphilic exporter-1/multidrug efflux pump
MSRSQVAVDAIALDLKNHPAVQDVIAFAGIDGITLANEPGGGALWVVLKPWEQRRGAGLSPTDVVDHIESYGRAHLRDARVMAFEPSPISGGSSTGGFEGFIQARSSADPQALAKATSVFLAAMERRSEAEGLGTNYRANVPQIRIDVDREKAKSLGVAIDELFTTLHSSFGAYYVNDFSYAGRVWEVQMQADAPFRARVDDLRNVFVKSASGTMIPLNSLVRVSEVTGPETVERFNGFPAARVYGRVAAGHSSGSAHQAMEEVARQVLPQGYVLSWSGTSYQQRVIGKSTNGAFLLSVLMVFLILAAQYERWSLPFAVILGVPFAVLGAFVAIWLRGLNNDIFFQIGLVTLVGLSAKNGILIVEYAVQLQAQGRTLRDAALEAARMRFRPIVMTSAAFVFGVLPLLFASGAGANSRHSIGTGVIGGMLVATFIATLFIPLLYMWVAGLAKQRG